MHTSAPPTTTSTARSRTASQCRPLSLTAHLEGPEPRRAGPRVRPQLVRGRPLRLLGQHSAERPPPACAHRLARRAHARLAPVAERVLHDAVLARMIADHAQPAARLQRRAQRRERQLDLRSEEHTSELQSRLHLVCRLLLEKKKKNKIQYD